MEEEVFSEEVTQDVEGCVRDFFLGCFNPYNSFEDEPEIVDGRLFGQNYDKIQVERLNVISRMNIMSSGRVESQGRDVC